MPYLLLGTIRQIWVTNISTTCNFSKNQEVRIDYVVSFCGNGIMSLTIMIEKVLLCSMWQRSNVAYLDFAQKILLYHDHYQYNWYHLLSKYYNISALI